MRARRLLAEVDGLAPLVVLVVVVAARVQAEVAAQGRRVANVGRGDLASGDRERAPRGSELAGPGDRAEVQPRAQRQLAAARDRAQLVEKLRALELVLGFELEVDPEARPGPGRAGEQEGGA